MRKFGLVGVNPPLPLTLEVGPLYHCRLPQWGLGQSNLMHFCFKIHLLATLMTFLRINLPNFMQLNSIKANQFWDYYVSWIHSIQQVPYTIRDAILTCARKPTWVSLIYRQLKSVKTEKTKSRKQICPDITVNSLGNPCSKHLSRKKGRATVGKICREGRF